jgi:hypothetical protein
VLAKFFLGKRVVIPLGLFSKECVDHGKERAHTVALLKSAQPTDSRALEKTRNCASVSLLGRNGQERFYKMMGPPW